MSVFSIQPTVLTDSNRVFKIPETVMSDYHNYLHTEVPNVVYDFELLNSWYDKDNPNHEKVMLRAEHYPINWKSKVGNSDASYNFGTDYDVTILKGDIVIREDGVIAMLNWDIQNEINRQITQAIKCNHFITIERHMDAVADRRGYKISEAHDEVIVEELPCVMSEYAGRPDYAAAQNTPGIHADMLTTVNLQWNEQTRNIKINDTFRWCDFKYRVVNISWAEVDINKIHGVITLGAKRIAGEDE